MAITSNYAGQAAVDIMLQAIKEEDTLRLGLINVVPDVGYKLNLRNLDVTLGVVDYACGTTAATGRSSLLRESFNTFKILKTSFTICKEGFPPNVERRVYGSICF